MALLGRRRVPAGSRLRPRLAEEIQRLPPGAALKRAMLDYARLRDEARRVATVQKHLDKRAKIAKIGLDSIKGHAMQTMSAKDAKDGFGRLIDLARMEPVTVEKHGRPVVVVMAVEEYQRLRESAGGPASSVKPSAEVAKRRKGTKQA